MVDDADAPDTLVKSSKLRVPSQDPDDETRVLHGYLFGDVIGRGGLGEVVVPISP